MSNIYDEITGRLIEELNRGVVPWRKPWKTNGWPTNLLSGNEYRGINVLVLSCLARGFESRYWVTFKQARQLGGYVKKGEKGTRIYFFNVNKKEFEDESTGEKKKIKI